MKKVFYPIILLVLLAALLASCGGDPAVTQSTMGGNATEPTTETTDTTATTDGGNVEPAPPEPVKDISITVVNGTANGKSTLLCSQGEVVALKAAVPAKGYAFTHWEDADGNVVSTNTTLDVTVEANCSYKAYYQVAFGSSGGQIMTNVEESWRQGAFTGELDAWTSGSESLTRVSFAEPLLLKKGETLSIILPQIVCPQAPDACPKLGNSGNCTLRAAIMILKKTGLEIGDVTKDYSVVSGSWGESYTASSDTYISIMIKWDKHGSEELLVSNDYMKDVKVMHYIPTDAVGSLIESYWNEELEDAIEQIEANREAAEGTLSEFFYMTDVHWLNNAQYSPALINYLA